MVHDDFTALGVSFQLHLQAERKSGRTIAAYMESVQRFSAWAREGESEGQSARRLTSPDGVTRTHIREWLVVELARVSGQTVVRHYSGVRQWFKFLAAEEEIKVDPTEGIKQPKIEEKLTDVPTEDVLKAVMKIVESGGNTFIDRRDAALIRVMISGGARAAEVAGMMVADVDLPGRKIRVMGKGAKERMIPLSNKAVAALDKYIRARRKRPQKDHPQLWLAERSRVTPFTTSGIRQILRRRCQEAGVPKEKWLHPHALRHFWVDECLRLGISEQDLMRLAGWETTQMAGRYAKKSGHDRAHQAVSRINPGDRI